MTPPQGSTTKQGYELQLGTNCLGPFLFTKKLIPILRSTASLSPQNSVRVVFVSSSAAELFTPKNGLDLDNMDYRKKDLPVMEKYSASKVGNYFHATELARRLKKDGIISVVSSTDDDSAFS